MTTVLRGFAALAALSACCVAEDAPLSDAALKRKIAELTGTVRTLREQDKTVAKPYQSATRELQKLKGEIASGDKSLPNLKSQLPKAKQQLEDARKKKDRKKLNSAQMNFVQLRERIELLDSNLPKWRSRIKQLTTRIPALRAAARKARVAHDAAAEELLALRISLQQRLVKSGRLALFSETVASVLHRRCIACHNARQKKGKLNLETYAEMMSGGESGAAVVAKDPAASLLMERITDGSMPPGKLPAVTKSEAAGIRRWIESGATLDAGRSEQDHVVIVMRKPPYPNPPKIYPRPAPITAIAVHGDLVATSGYHEVLLWSIKQKKLVRRITNVTQRVLDIAFSPDGRTIAVAGGIPGRIGDVRLYDIETGNLKADVLTATDSVLAVAFDSTGKRIAVAGTDRELAVIDLKNPRLRWTTEDHSDWITDVAFAGRESVVTTSRDGTTKIYDLSDHLLLGSFKTHKKPVRGAAALGDSIGTIGDDGQLRLWRASDAKQRKASSIGALPHAIAATGKNFVVGSSDGGIRIYSAEAKLVRTLAKMPSPVLSIATSKGTIAAGSRDGLVRVWDDKGELLGEWKAVPR